MSARRYVVRRLNGYRKGDKRWVVWDNASGGWADDAQTTRRDAQDICNELEAETAAASTPPQEAQHMHDEPDWPETCRAAFVTGGHDPYSTGCDRTPGHGGPHGGLDPFGGDGRVEWSGGGSAGGDPLPYRDVRWIQPVGTRPDTGAQPGGQGPQPRAETDTSDGDDPAGPGADAMNGVPPSAALLGAADPAVGDEPAATPRRASGSLRGAILDILHDHPGQQYTTGELCRLIDRANEGTGIARAGAGAVRNAVITLVSQGHAVQIVEGTIALAPTTD